MPATASRTATVPTVDEAASSLLERGYAVLPSLLDARQRAHVAAVLDEVIVRDAVPAIHGFGFAIHPLLTRDRRVGPYYAHPLVMAAASRLLGDAAHVVHTGARVSDPAHAPNGERVGWHNHAYTQDLIEIAPGDPRRGLRPERLLFGWYLDGSDDDNGALVVLPRRFDDLLAPLGAHDQPWPGEVAVHVPPGSAVMFTVDLWHAVRAPRATAKRRRLMGAHIQGRSNPKPHPEDHVHTGPEVAAAVVADPALRDGLRWH